jgi:transcription-repair coupling factor (superfamily II helicase)
VIVDEEQRFGVEHKEALKHLRAAVDVLSMSATPIPAHTGDGDHRHPRDVDDHTPPEERHRVLSFRSGPTTTPGDRRASDASFCA